MSRATRTGSDCFDDDPPLASCGGDDDEDESDPSSVLVLEAAARFDTSVESIEPAENVLASEMFNAKSTESQRPLRTNRTMVVGTRFV